MRRTQAGEEHNARLVLPFAAPVVTTVVDLLPGADRDRPDTFRPQVRDRGRLKALRERLR